VTLRRTWKPGDVIDIAMPFSVRVERAIDDPSVQSLFYGPNLLAVQNEPLGETLETGLLELELYRHMKLDGDLAPALTPAGAPLHFTLGERVLVPFHEADPQPGNTMPYHLYFRRREPNIVFASRDSGVPNRPRPADRLTFLDVLWDRAPFASAGAFTAAVQATATEWERLGLVQPNERSQILQAANSAARELEG
jgi:hypothetical protein